VPISLKFGFIGPASRLFWSFFFAQRRTACFLHLECSVFHASVQLKSLLIRVFPARNTGQMLCPFIPK
ncbi:MAG: hypothetical protein P8X69_15275, partial [Maritimibacter sp.]